MLLFFINHIYYRHQPEHPIFTLHNIENQLDFRRFVIAKLNDPVIKAKMEWEWDTNNLQLVDDWISSMSENYIELDEKFIRLASEVLKRKIEVYHVVGDHILSYNAEAIIHNPLYLLCFEEYKFTGGHYQSIVRLADLQSYQVRIKNKTSIEINFAMILF